MPLFDQVNIRPTYKRNVTLFYKIRIRYLNSLCLFLTGNSIVGSDVITKAKNLTSENDFVVYNTINTATVPNLPNIKYKYKYRLKISVKISKINAMRNDLVTLHRGKAGQAKSNISLSRGKTSSRRWKMAQNSF